VFVQGHSRSNVESDIREIRKLLKSYMTRLENKDAAARTTKEWRIVARVLDRIFFFCYIGTIVVSLFTIFPHDEPSSRATDRLPALRTMFPRDGPYSRTTNHLPARRTVFKPNSITLASLELAPNTFEAGSCQIQLH